MAKERRRSLREAEREHRSALKDLEDEVNMQYPDEIPAAAQRERDAHADMVRARQDAARRTRAKDSTSEDSPPAR